MAYGEEYPDFDNQSGTLIVIYTNVQACTLYDVRTHEHVEITLQSKMPSCMVYF